MGDPYQPSNVPQPYDPMGGYAPPPTNGVGLTGFILSLCGLMCGLLFPVGLVVSLFGLNKQPKGFAIAGTVIGAVGSVMMLAVVALYGTMILACIGFGAFVQPRAETQMTISQSNGLLQDYYAENGAEPDQGTADSLIGGELDGWGNPIRYEPQGDGNFELRSAGADGQFDTDDDIYKQHTYGMPDYGAEEITGDDADQSSSTAPAAPAGETEAGNAGGSEEVDGGESQGEPGPIDESDDDENDF